MKSAIVTGASKGIGIEIVKELNRLAFMVYGIARDFSSTNYESNDFKRILCDIRDISSFEKVLKSIRTKDNRITLLVNNAGIGYFGPHETLSSLNISQMIDVNLKAPIIASSILLNDLKKNSGFIINISSVTAKKISTFGCAYAATKSGIAHFGNSLFEEVRKQNVKVVTIYPDMTSTGFFDNLDFTYDQEFDCHLKPSTISNAINFILNQPKGTIITELSITPQKNKIFRKKI